MLELEKNQQILDQLSQIIDPDLGKDIVSLGFVKNLTVSEEGAVVFTLQLTTPACPVKDQFKQQAEELVKALEWVSTVSVSIGASRPQSTLLKPAKGLEKVSSIIAVASCKGGVGKSTVAVNLAYTLALNGARVGLFDADVYGPSLPTMIQLDFQGLRMEGQWIIPPEHRGVKLMSFGFVTASSGENGPAMMRGPMVSQIINQLLTTTYWGELDYLILDLPPGTGDIQLTLSQLVPITAAVVVTTPSKLSHVDVIKGIQMFDTLKVPTIAAVENMSVFYCDCCSTPHHIFGKSSLEALKTNFGLSASIEIPLEPALCEAGDTGSPMVMHYPGSKVGKAFSQLAEHVVRQTSKIRFGADQKPILNYLEGANEISVTIGSISTTIPAPRIRMACRCAHCIDEWTGENRLSLTADIQAITVSHIQPVGNYAYGFQWSDGHSSLISYDWLETLAQANEPLKS